MRFYRASEDKDAPSTGDLAAAHRWGLPGVICSTCGNTWADIAEAYPCVDLSSLPERQQFEQPRAEPHEEYVRLRELVRPWTPRAATLAPGTRLGPLVGKASGTFGQLFMQNPWSLALRRDALERLQQAHVQGLLGCSMDVRFRGKNPLDLLDLQIEPHGRLHPDCLPPDPKPPCPTCGYEEGSPIDSLLLDAASLPADLDLFRLTDATTVIVASERFADAVRHLELEGIIFKELPQR